VQQQLNITQYYVYHPLAIVVLAIGVFVVTRAARSWSYLSLLVAVIGILLFVMKTVAIPPGSSDYAIFLRAGFEVISGRNPYADQAMVSPPTALPLFALFAALPCTYGPAIWAAVNLVATILLVPLARITLAAQDRESRIVLPEPALWALTVIFSLSIALHFAINLGQLSILVAWCILAAIYCQSQGQAVLAGICLALASVKPHTMIPILTLFLRKSDLRTWIALALVAILLCLSGGSISEFPGRIRAEMSNIAKLSAIGEANDYSFDAPFDHTIVGLDRTLYCMGLRDRSAIRWGQIIILAAIGAWLIGLALRPQRFPREAICSMVALYSMIFFYHRTHDMAILALPLVYAAIRMRADRLVERRLSLAVLVTIILLLYMHPMIVKIAVQRVAAGQRVLEYLGQAVLLPYATWLILLAMVCIALAAGWLGSETPAPSGTGGTSGRRRGRMPPLWP
jgi:Glycosyltransferase family 87